MGTTAAHFDFFLRCPVSFKMGTTAAHWLCLSLFLRSLSTAVLKGYKTQKFWSKASLKVKWERAFNMKVRSLHVYNTHCASSLQYFFRFYLIPCLLMNFPMFDCTYYSFLQFLVFFVFFICLALLAPTGALIVIVCYYWSGGNFFRFWAFLPICI